MSWYRAGTVSVVQNSTTVTGAGTAFAANSRVGDGFVGPDGREYEVTNIASDLVLSILPAYIGATASGGTYAITPIQGYNKDTADALREASRQVGSALDGLEESVLAAANSADTAQAAQAATAALEASATTAASQALQYRDAAGLSANSASQDAASALASKNAAAQSETNSGQSAASALSSKNAAAQSATDAAAAAATAGGLGVGRGYIDGLTLGWVSATSISIGAGSAYIPSVSKVIAYAGGTIVPAGAANSFIHVYVTDVGAIEQSATAPARYSNQAHQKTGDATRRYIGSLLVGAANNIYKFHHHPIDSSMLYTFGNPTVAPFRLLNGVSGLGSVSTSASCPVTAHTLIGSFQTTGSGSAQFTPSDAGTSAAAGWQVFTSTGTVANSSCRIADDRTLTYFTSSTNLAYVYTLGYYFDR